MTFFKTVIKSKKCFHDWKILQTEIKRKNVLEIIEVKYSYLYCPKCCSEAGQNIED